MRPARRKHQIAERSASRDEPELMDPGLEDCPNLTRIPLRTHKTSVCGVELGGMVGECLGLQGE